MQTQNMREAIEKKGFSRRYVARQAGIDKSYFNDCVRRNRPPKLEPEKVLRLCNVLEISLEELVALYE